MFKDTRESSSINKLTVFGFVVSSDQVQGGQRRANESARTINNLSVFVMLFISELPKAIQVSVVVSHVRRALLISFLR